MGLTTFSTSTKEGLSVAKLLHDQGFTRLCILSGKDFRGEEVSEYLTVILKGSGVRELKKVLFPKGNPLI